MITWGLSVIALMALIIHMVRYHWSRRHLYTIANKLKGPPGIRTLPLIGNAHIFFCNTEDIFNKISSLFENTEGKEPFKFWFGSDLVIGLKNPVHLEKIMSSSRFAYKHELYDFMGKFLGEGLISASGLKPKYKLHRRAIQPLLDIKFVGSCLKILQAHTDICMEKLDQRVDRGTFDIHNITVRCFMDTIGDVILGHNINSQQLGLNGFCRACIDMYNLGFKRMVKPWLHPDLIYNILPDKVKYDDIMTSLNGFIQEVIIESWNRRKLNGENSKQIVPSIDRIAEYIEENPNVFNSEDFMNHLMSLFAAAFDTLTIVSSFAVLCFGMYPEYQKKAVEEIRKIIGEFPKEVTLEEINKLTYLDMCLKDVMRLFPIAPFILKRTLVDYQLDKWVIPKEAAILISIFNIQRDGSLWQNPNHFYPDHFLPEAVKKRHVYAYFPFSAGPRGCVGKTLASVELKLFLLNLLQRFEIEADGKVPDIELRSDISIRPKKGYNCRLKKRIWQ